VDAYSADSLFLAQVGVDAYSWLHKGGGIQHSVDVEKIGCCHRFVMEFFCVFFPWRCIFL
jgi:hypothetical protein